MPRLIPRRSSHGDSRFGFLARMRVRTKLILLVLLPVCSLLVLASIAAVDDFRTAARLQDFRSATRLSVASAQAAAALADERTAATLRRLGVRSFDRRRTAAAQRAVDAALRRAAPDAQHGAGTVDVAGSLDALRRRLNALRLQAAGGSLGFQEIVEDYGVLIRGLSGLVRDLDSAQPTPATGRAANAYVALVRALEGAEQERVTVAAALLRGLRSVRVRGVLVEADALDDFRHFAAGRLVADLNTLLLEPAGLTVQRARDLLVRDPARIPRQISLEQWLTAAGTRIGALRRLEHGAADELDTTTSADLDAARADAWRTVAASVTVLVLLVGLGLVLLRSITQPLGEVAEAARMLSAGRLASGVTYTGRDEIGEVATAFRDVQVTTDRFAGEIRAMSVAVENNELEHRANAAAFAGTWGELMGGMNDTMAAFSDLQEQRQSAERESERIFEMSRDPLCVIGSDDQLKRVNPAMERVLGYPRDGLTRRSVLDVVHPDDREIFSALVHGEHAEPFESRMICADGSVRWLEWNARAAPEEGLIYGVGRDITESRRTREEQAALRRVATLVARDVAPEVVFGAVAEEVGNVLPGVDQALVARYLPGESIEFVGGWSRVGDTEWVGKIASIGGKNVSTAVFETMQPARIDHLADDAMPITAVARGAGARSSAGAPITIEGRLWGLMIVASAQQEALPVGIEHELAGFIELVATAIANAQAREELAASRTRIVTAADEARRRIERDLHDGVQQRLVVLGLELQAARALANGGLPARDQLDQIGQSLTNVVEELREISSGIHPVVLRHGGLRAGIGGLARRAGVPVKVDVPAALDLPDPIEVAAYYVASEAFTNTAKHAHAASIEVSVGVDERELELTIRDDGIGGATVGAGSGLIGLIDRVQAVGGRIEITSPRGVGTTLHVSLPLASTPTGSLGKSA